ncbi:MAG: hypothetical protein ACO4AU_08800 [bacterium]
MNSSPTSGISRFLQNPRPHLGLFLIALIALYALSAHIRFEQFERWKENRGAYFVGDRPMMTTLDAPFWLRMGREHNEGIYGVDELRNYPDGTTAFRELPQKFRNPEDASATGEKATPPMLSWLIAQSVGWFDGNYYLAGTLLVPVLAGLFILPLGYYFYLLGVPAGGLLGGFVGTFCAEYFMRSSIGRIDTDMLNLFFPALAAVFILHSARARTVGNLLLFAALAGGTLWGFQWWYGKPGFTLAFFGVLIATQALHHVAPRWILASALLFALLAGPGTLFSGAATAEGFLKMYFTIEAEAPAEYRDNTTETPASFPNVMTTISEAERIPLSDVLPGILNSELLGWLGLLAFAVLAICRWRWAVPLLPMLLLGLLGFQSARRFLMFLAPFLGVGFGFLITVAVQLVWESLTRPAGPPASPKNRKQRNAPVVEPAEEERPSWWKHPLARDVVTYAAVVIACWGLSSKTAIAFVPGPSIPTPLYSTFDQVRQKTPENAILYTWWDFGYALIDATQRGVFHDGGSQFSPKTYFIARSFLSPSPEEMQKIIRSLGSQGIRGIEDNNTSPANLLSAVLNPGGNPENPVYVLFTADMIGKYSALSSIGSWDLEKGGKQVKGFQNLRCRDITNNLLNCENAQIDLNQGTINNRFPLIEVVQVLGGKVIGRKGFNRKDGYYLQILMSNPRQFSDIYLVEPDVFRSNFNQMYLLGQHDPDRFEEVFNQFPLARMYRVKW